jgi:hypothetical protein
MSWRYELKYVVSARAQEKLRPILREHLLRDEFTDASGTYPVLSQYYDGPRLPLYLEKVSGVEQRLKVRLRTYAWSFGTSAPWFLELKRKENASIAKQRLRIATGSIDPLRPSTWTALGAEGARFAQASELLHLEPTAGVWYQREALVSPAGDLRITWDELVRGLYPGEAMTRALLYDERRSALPDDLVVLEVKAAQTLPHWLVTLIARAELTPRSVSKYVLAMNALGLSRKVLTTC